MAKRPAISTPNQNRLHATYQKMILMNPGRTLFLQYPELANVIKVSVESVSNELRAEMFNAALEHAIQRYTEALQNRVAITVTAMELKKLFIYLRAIDYKYFKSPAEGQKPYWVLSHPVKEVFQDFVILSLDRREDCPCILRLAASLKQMSVPSSWEIHEASGLPTLK